MIEPTRIRVLRSGSPTPGRYVLYWMQQSQRAHHNPALEHALARANGLGLPLLVGFGLTDGYPEANARHYAFMLQGLAETKATLAARQIPMVVRLGPPAKVALTLSQDAAIVVCDRGYLRHQTSWRSELAEQSACPVEEVEGDVVVPVAEVSSKAEYAARTIRPKVNGQLGDYCNPLPPGEVRHIWHGPVPRSDVAVEEWYESLRALDINRSVKPVRRFTGGTSRARRLLSSFLRSRVHGYADDRNEPSAYRVSYLSPYLHFGQISPVEIVLKARQATSPAIRDTSAFLEELVVRRELAVNYVAYTAQYDTYSALPNWARQTLDAHRDDRRPHRYTARDLAATKTHDRYWNAAMREMVHTGYMHNYMRMYWAKKILEWSNTPEYAFKLTLELNNRYFLDGRDPNSYANVAWCYGLHDRAWKEREIYGKVRSMTAKGLERKFDMEAYISEVDRLVKAERANPDRITENRP